MFDLIKLRKRHGYQAIPDIKNAKLMNTHRGFPVIDKSKCVDGCAACIDICPTKAISKEPLSIDLGKCIFCGECERICSNGAIQFNNELKLACSERKNLIVVANTSFEDYSAKAIEVRKEIHKLFGRSLKLRQVSAAGCNGCEMELNACGNVNFDMGRFGIDFVASPRHADGIVITGPVSKNMAPALMDTYKSINEPKLVIAVGACAISGGVFAESDEINRTFFDEIKVDLFIPGCSPHPLTFIHGIMDFISGKY